MKEEEKKKAAALGAAALAGLAFFLCRRHAQQPDKAMLYGLVTDEETGNPVSGIDVTCDGYAAKTTALGNYEMLNIEPGTYTVRFIDPYGRYEILVV